MGISRKKLAVGLVIFAALAAAYLGYGHYLAGVAQGLAMETMEQTDYALATDVEKYLHSPMVAHWFGGAQVWLKYDDPSLVAAGSVQLAFRMERQEGQWQIAELSCKQIYGNPW